MHNLHISILDCGSSPLESRSRVTLHRIEQISISSVDLGLCLKIVTELYDLKIIFTLPVMLFLLGAGLYFIYIKIYNINNIRELIYIYINVLRISCIFFRVVYCNVEQSMKVFNFELCHPR